jgi:predicted DNA-binding transcriptional regulator YafY
VEVLEPQELREAMAEQAEWLARKYRGRLGWSGS